MIFDMRSLYLLNISCILLISRFISIFIFFISSCVQEGWAGKLVANIREEIFILGVFFLSIHLHKVLLSKYFKHFVHDLLVLALCWLEDAHVELGRDTISEDAIYVGSHYFKMQQGLEELIEIVEADLHCLVLK